MTSTDTHTWTSSESRWWNCSCGYATPDQVEAQAHVTAALFDSLTEQERLLQTLRSLAVMGSDVDTRYRNRLAWRREQDAYNARIDAMTPDALLAYTQARRAATSA